MELKVCVLVSLYVMDYFIYMYRMNQLAFSRLPESTSIVLRVAVSVTSTVIQLPEVQWKPINKATTFKSYHQNNFPEQLDSSCTEQLVKVYNNCIHPSQFLPQLFTLDNAELILDSGKYIAEYVLPIASYTSLGGKKVSQHSRHIGLPGIK